MTSLSADTVWPKELVLNRSERTLKVSFDDGAVFSLPAEYLRVHSPSAEVQGHNPAERRIVGGKRNVGIGEVEPVGNYAVRLIFDDGHSTGIFSWSTLHALGRDHDRNWTLYLSDLRARGLGRDP